LGAGWGISAQSGTAPTIYMITGCVFSLEIVMLFNNNKNIEIIHAHAQKWPILIWPLIIVLGLCMNISRKIVLAIISVDLSRFARKVEIALPAPS
jgi:hypothetical protein